MNISVRNQFIVGIRYISYTSDPDKDCHKKLFYVKKAVWIIIMITLTASFAYMVFESYNRFYEHRTFSRVQQIHMKQFKFPKILFCPIAVKIDLSFDDEAFGWLTRLVLEIIAISGLEIGKNYTEVLNTKKIRLIRVLQCTIEKLENESKLKKNINIKTTSACYCLYRIQSNDEICIQYENQLVSQGILNLELNKTLNNFESFVLNMLNLNITEFFMKKVLLEHIESVANMQFKRKIIRTPEVFQKVYTIKGHCLKFDLSSNSNMSEQDKTVFAAGITQSLQLTFLLNKKTLEEKLRFYGFYGIGISLISSDEENDYDLWEMWELFSSNWVIVPFKSIANIALTYKKSYKLPVSIEDKSKDSCVYPQKAVKRTIFEYFDLTRLLLVNSDPPELKYFKIYNRKKCIFECFVAEIIKEFNCVPIYVKQHGLYEDIKVCSILIESLIEDHLAALASMETLCTHCKPSCKNSEFQVEMVNYGHSSDELKKYFNESTQSYDYLSRISIMNIYYKDMIVEVQNEEFEFSFLDLITSIGGYIGLFLGGSIVSIIEIIGFIISLIMPTRLHSRNNSLLVN